MIPFHINYKVKYIILLAFSLCLCLISCSQDKETNALLPSNPIETVLEIPNTIVIDTLLHYNNKTSRWTLDSQLYSGYAVSYYQDSILKEKTGILNGKKQNQTTRWYPDRHLKQVANYYKGKLHGEKKKWSSDANHTLISQLNYHLGKAHGEQKLWYPSGQLFKKLNLSMGKEEGIQQGFRKNGNLFANYEAKEGRIFGLKKATLCFGLEDENIQYEK